MAWYTLGLITKQQEVFKAIQQPIKLKYDPYRRYFCINEIFNWPLKQSGSENRIPERKVRSYSGPWCFHNVPIMNFVKYLPVVAQMPRSTLTPQKGLVSIYHSYGWLFITVFVSIHYTVVYGYVNRETFMNYLKISPYYLKHTRNFGQFY